MRLDRDSALSAGAAGSHVKTMHSRGAVGEIYLPETKRKNHDYYYYYKLLVVKSVSTWIAFVLFLRVQGCPWTSIFQLQLLMTRFLSPLFLPSYIDIALQVRCHCWFGFARNKKRWNHVSGTFGYLTTPVDSQSITRVEEIVEVKKIAFVRSGFLSSHGSSLGFDNYPDLYNRS